MRSRRKAREAALQALYQCDTLEDWCSERIDLYFEIYSSSLDCVPSANSTPSCEAPDKAEADAAFAKQKAVQLENLQFAKTLIFGVAAHLKEIDQRLSEASLHWTVPRMARVDRNILRLACFEIGFLTEIPLNVSINEAIELAKLYGAEESPMFVNGVLDRVARGASNHARASKKVA